MQPEPPLDRDRGASTVDESSASPGVRPTESRPAESTPPPPATGWGSAPAATVVPRPTGVTVASVILMILGIIIGLFGALFFAAGSIVGQLNPGQLNAPGVPAGAIASVINVLGVIAVAYGLASLIAGIGSFTQRDWGRILGIIVGILGLLFGLLGLLGALSPGADAGSLVFSLALVVLFGFVVYALATAGRWYAARRAA